MTMMYEITPEISIKGGCDNVDCEHQDVPEVFMVVLTAEFDHEICWWCKECIERDSYMIYMDEYNYSVYYNELYGIGDDLHED